MVRRGKDGAPALEEHPGGGHIIVTAQQSRYALDAVDAPTSKEVCPIHHLQTRVVRLTWQDHGQRSLYLGVE
jgi:hypothetical protein